MSLPGFEIETAPLSEYEQSLVPVFVAGFSKKIGKEKAITNKEIIAALKPKGIAITDSRVRKIINVIRHGDHFGEYILKATSHGYYLTNDQSEIMEYVQSLEGREAAIRSIKNKVLGKLKRA